jgi:hypothetical protein
MKLCGAAIVCLVNCAPSSRDVGLSSVSGGSGASSTTQGGLSISSSGSSSGGAPASTGNSSGGSSGSDSTGTTGGGASGTTGSTGFFEGTTTGGGGWDGDAGPCSNQTAFPTEFQVCNGSGGIECQCGHICRYDPLFFALIEANDGVGVCELRCTSDLECDNGGSACVVVMDAGGVCVPNVCDAGIGVACTANNGTEDGGGGTCVVISEYDIGLCMPNGVATDSCDDVQYGFTNDDPRAGLPYFQMYSQPASETSLFCAAGSACLGVDARQPDAGDQCLRLCSTSEPACDAGETCVTEDPRDLTWGFCRQCPLVDLLPTSKCYAPSDCCGLTYCLYGRCCNGPGFDGDGCSVDSDCCGHCDDGGLCAP